MGKHIIEEEALKGSGFNLIKVEDASEISSDNTGKILNIKGDGTIDLSVRNNSLMITTKIPVFKTKDW